MSVGVLSFAKINVGLRIGVRTDGFHELLTVYQTIALHDILRVSVRRGRGIEIQCSDSRVPKDESNTCFRMVDRALRAMKTSRHVVIEIEKKLPVQGGLGGASSNAIAALLGLERALRQRLPDPVRLRIAEEVGSDLPLFLVGGTVLGVGRGERVYALPDLPTIAGVVVSPEVGVSTAKAFASWDRMAEPSHPRKASKESPPELTVPEGFDRIDGFGRALSAWLSGMPYSGAPRWRGRRENPLLELVRAGIDNDFEKVVFPEYPELSDAKGALVRAGAKYASLSGSGSALYGLFASREAARRAVRLLRKQGWTAMQAATLGRERYWRRIFDC